MSIESNERLSKISARIALAAGAAALCVAGIEVITDAIPDEALLPIGVSAVFTVLEGARFSSNTARWADEDRARQQG